MFGTRKNVHGNGRRVINLIMLIEDDMDHAELIVRTTQEYPIPNQVLHFSDGQSALDYLFRRNDFNNPVSSPRPQVILDESRMIPVIMLTTSAGERDMTRVYSNHVNSYLVKPLGGEEFKKLTETLCLYWLGNNRSPKIWNRIIQVEKSEPDPPNYWARIEGAFVTKLIAR